VKSLATISAKGGSGKTALAVSLACLWATTSRVLLVDCDPQDAGSATWWLNRTDDTLPNLTWTKTQPEELANLIGRIDPTIGHVIIDTPPQLAATALISVAQAVDVVLIPGLPVEVATIVQTARTITHQTNTPTAAVFTRATTLSMRASIAVEATTALASINCPVIGQIRGYADMAAAPLRGQRPDQLPSPAKHQLAIDLNDLSNVLNERFPNA